MVKTDTGSHATFINREDFLVITYSTMVENKSFIQFETLKYVA